jgi:hypothetical protein
MRILTVASGAAPDVEYGYMCSPDLPGAKDGAPSNTRPQAEYRCATALEQCPLHVEPTPSEPDLEERQTRNRRDHRHDQQVHHPPIRTRDVRLDAFVLDHNPRERNTGRQR